jgi:hypothetical protein
VGEVQTPVYQKRGTSEKGISCCEDSKI